MARTTRVARKSKLLLSASIVGVLLLSTSCDEGAFVVDPVALPDVPKFSLSPSSMTLGVGESATITASLAKANGTPVNPQSLKWETVDVALATVTREGVVTGVAAGHTVIIASSGKLADTIWVTIVEHAARAGVHISTDTVGLAWLNATATMTAEVRDDEGTLVAQPGLTWKSLNPEIATADDMGVITAKSVGMALIVATAACCNQADTAHARVYQAVDSVALEPENVSLSEGSSVQLRATAMDRGGSTIDGASFQFRSADESIAQVTSDGLLKSQSSGATTVTASSDGQSDAVTVEVSGAVSTGGSARYPNEPAGYEPWFEHDWQTFPQSRSELLSHPSASGTGYFHSWGNFDNHWERAPELIDDPDARHGFGKSLRFILPAGHPIGRSIFSWSHRGTGDIGLKEIYASFWLYLEPNPADGLWEMPEKWRLFSLNRHTGGDCTHSTVLGLSLKRYPGGVRGDFGDFWTWGYNQCASASSSTLANSVGGEVGQWLQIELQLKRLNVGTTWVEDGDSEYRLWINGTKIIDAVVTHSMSKPITQQLINTNPSGAWESSTNRQYKLRDDYLRYSGFYVSGVAF